MSLLTLAPENRSFEYLCHFLHRIATLILIALVAEKSTAAQNQEQKTKESSVPNVVLILTDDQGYGDLSCHGNPTLKTPHLDQLAREGMRLTSYYAGNTVCRPSRLCLWTGMHAGHTAIDCDNRASRARHRPQRYRDSRASLLK